MSDLKQAVEQDCWIRERSDIEKDRDELLAAALTWADGEYNWKPGDEAIKDCVDYDLQLLSVLSNRYVDKNSSV